MNRGVLFVLVFLLALPVTLAASLEINISEDGKVTSFYDEYYVTQVTGSVTVNNPSTLTIYNIEIPIYLASYTVRSTNNTDFAFIEDDKIFILELEGNSSQTFDYEITGISTEDLNNDSEAILYNAITSQSSKIYSSIMGTLLKAPIEDATITGRNKTRLVSVDIRNPSGFRFIVDMVKVVKTLINDPSAQVAEWDFSSQYSSLEAFQRFEFDLLDTNATEGEIYWLQSDIYLDNFDLFYFQNITRFSQDDLFEPITNGTNITYNDSVTEFLEKRVFVRKTVSSKLLFPGAKVNVSVIVNNFGSAELSGTLTDTWPTGFQVSNVYTDEGTQLNNSLVWPIDVNARNARRYLYELEFTDTDSVGVDYFDPATVTYQGNNVYSQSIPFVRQYVPEKKIYLQKSLDFRANGDVAVSITVRNLGESSLSPLIVKEFLGPSNEFKEISQPFTEKGVWVIETLSPGEIWETSYVTDKTNVLNTFPEVFGVPRSSIFQNILLKNVVESSFKILEVSTIEVAGIITLILVIIVYLLPKNFLISLKKKFVKDLYATKHELDLLKETSSHRTSFGSQSSSQAPQSNHTQAAKVQTPVATQPAKNPHHEARQKKIEETQAILDKIKNQLEKKEK